MFEAPGEELREHQESGLGKKGEIEKKSKFRANTTQLYTRNNKRSERESRGDDEDGNTSKRWKGNQERGSEMSNLRNQKEKKQI